MKTMKSKTRIHALFNLGAACALLFSPSVQAQDVPGENTAAPLDAGKQVGDKEGSPELTEAADQAIEKGLQYLLKTQKPDGSWSSAAGQFEIAGTSLGLMAFMVKGHFPGFGRHGAALDRAKDFLLKKAEDSPTGVVGGMYEHGLFTLAMSEMWGMTNNTEDNKKIQTALERAVQVILRAQSPLGGWHPAVLARRRHRAGERRSPHRDRWCGGRFVLPHRKSDSRC